jgi:hypothetical protein
MVVLTIILCKMDAPATSYCSCNILLLKYPAMRNTGKRKSATLANWQLIIIEGRRWKGREREKDRERGRG